MNLPNCDIVDSDCNPDLVKNWKSYVHAKFPWLGGSMKKIEMHLDTHPILLWLSGEALPKTDRPLIYSRSLSRMSGSVLGIRRKSLDLQSWLSTDEIQFLFAFLLRNQDSNQFFHVLDPAITNKVATVQEAMQKILEETATDEDHRAYEYNLEGIQDYIDSKLNVFEHKFLVFLCNQSHSHWVSVVVVNPFLVFNQYLAEGKDYSGRTGVMGDDDFVGWSVFNSNPRQQEESLASRELCSQKQSNLWSAAVS